MSGFFAVTYVHLPPVCVCVFFLCPGRSVELALDSTCCSWTHWAQLEPQSVRLCVCVREREKKKRHCVFLCDCLYVQSIIFSVFVFASLYYVEVCPPIDNYKVLQLCAPLASVDTHRNRGH